MKIFFSVGEPSGDLHGGNLIAELRRAEPTIECVGFGGPKMAAAGCELLVDLTQLAVMWFARALVNLHKFLAVLSLADRYFRHHRPDAVVLIDYPGLNWWIARRARAHKIPVYYYGSPQLWAWAGWRVRKMRRLVDHVLCKLPFEAAWFRERGCEATYVGHPYFDELAARDVDASPLPCSDSRGPIVAILPGSRTQEVTQNLPSFLKAAERIHHAVPSATFVIASYNQRQAEIAQQLVHGHRVPVTVVVGRTGQIIQASTCCMACSGSVSLELFYHETPAVILYRIGRFAYWLQNRFRTVKYITLANLLATDDIFCRPGQSREFESHAAEYLPFPEFLTWKDCSADIADRITCWLTDPHTWRDNMEHVRTLRTLYAKPGASRTAAQFLLAQLSRREVPIPRPHFLPRQPSTSQKRTSGLVNSARGGM